MDNVSLLVPSQCGKQKLIFISLSKIHAVYSFRVTSIQPQVSLKGPKMRVGSRDLYRQQRDKDQRETVTQRLFFTFGVSCIKRRIYTYQEKNNVAMNFRRPHSSE